MRSCLQGFTLKAQLAKAVEQDDEIQAARREQQNLRRKLRNSRLRRGEYLERCATVAAGLPGRLAASLAPTTWHSFKLKPVLMQDPSPTMCPGCQLLLHSVRT